MAVAGPGRGTSVGGAALSRMLVLEPGLESTIGRFSLLLSYAALCPYGTLEVTDAALVARVSLFLAYRSASINARVRTICAYSSGVGFNASFRWISSHMCR